MKKIIFDFDEFKEWIENISEEISYDSCAGISIMCYYRFKDTQFEQMFTDGDWAGCDLDYEIWENL